jgi:hypothetical protein
MRAHHRRTKRLSTVDLALIRQAIVRSSGGALQTSISAEIPSTPDPVEHATFQSVTEEIVDRMIPESETIRCDRTDLGAPERSERGRGGWMRGLMVATVLLGGAMVITRLLVRQSLIANLRRSISAPLQSL